MILLAFVQDSLRLIYSCIHINLKPVTIHNKLPFLEIQGFHLEAAVLRCLTLHGMCCTCTLFHFCLSILSTYNKSTNTNKPTTVIYSSVSLSVSGAHDGSEGVCMEGGWPRGAEDIHSIYTEHTPLQIAHRPGTRSHLPKTHSLSTHAQLVRKSKLQQL